MASSSNDPVSWIDVVTQQVHVDGPRGVKIRGRAIQCGIAYQRWERILRDTGTSVTASDCTRRADAYTAYVRATSEFEEEINHG